MNLHTTVLSAVLLGLAVAAACARSTRPAGNTTYDVRQSGDSGFVVRRLARDVYAIQRLEPLGLINESNTLVIVGDTGVVVVDAQSSSARTRETLDAIRKVTRAPVTTLVHTHWHDDHVVGSEVYKGRFPALRIVGHRTAPEDHATTGVSFRKSVASRGQTIGFLRNLVESRTSFLGGAIDAEEARSHQLSAWLLEDHSNASPAFIPLVPDVLVDSVLELRLGRRRISIFHPGPGHTRGDLVVFLPEERILATGDLLMWPVTFVGSTSFPREFAGTLHKLRDLDAQTVVPGHGPVLDRARAARHFANVIDLLQTIVTHVTALAPGATLEETKASVDLSTARSIITEGSVLRRVLFRYYVEDAGVTRAYELERGSAP